MLAIQVLNVGVRHEMLTKYFDRGELPGSPDDAMNHMSRLDLLQAIHTLTDNSPPKTYLNIMLCSDSL
jgi:hypothetical protein